LGARRTTPTDAANQLTTETWKDALGATVNTKSYTYDDAGNVLTATDNDGTYTRTYDAFGRDLTQSGLYGVSFTFGYDARDRTSVADSLGGTTASAYDDADRLTSRTFTDGTNSLRIDLGYDSRDERTGATRFADLAAR